MGASNSTKADGRLVERLEQDKKLLELLQPDFHARLRDSHYLLRLYGVVNGSPPDPESRPAAEATAAGETVDAIAGVSRSNSQDERRGDFHNTRGEPLVESSGDGNRLSTEVGGESSEEKEEASLASLLSARPFDVEAESTRSTFRWPSSGLLNLNQRSAAGNSAADRGQENAHHLGLAAGLGLGNPMSVSSAHEVSDATDETGHDADADASLDGRLPHNRSINHAERAHTLHSTQERLRHVLSSSSTALNALPQFARDFEGRIAVLRAIHVILLKQRKAARARALKQVREVSGISKGENLELSNKEDPDFLRDHHPLYLNPRKRKGGQGTIGALTAVVQARFLSALSALHSQIRASSPSCAPHQKLVELAIWLSELPPLSLYFEWSPRPSKGSRQNTLKALETLAEYAVEIIFDTNLHPETRRCGRLALAGIAFASAHPKFLLRLTQICVSGNAKLVPLKDKLQDSRAGTSQSTSKSSSAHDCDLIEARILNRQLNRSFLIMDKLDSDGNSKLITSVKPFPKTDIDHGKEGSHRLSKHVVEKSREHRWRQDIAFGDWVEIQIPCEKEIRKKSSNEGDHQDASRSTEESRSANRHRWVSAQVIHPRRSTQPPRDGEGTGMHPFSGNYIQLFIDPLQPSIDPFYYNTDSQGDYDPAKPHSWCSAAKPYRHSRKDVKQMMLMNYDVSGERWQEVIPGDSRVDTGPKGPQHHFFVHIADARLAKYGTNIPCSKDNIALSSKPPHGSLASDFMEQFWNASRSVNTGATQSKISNIHVSNSKQIELQKSRTEPVSKKFVGLEDAPKAAANVELGHVEANSESKNHDATPRNETHSVWTRHKIALVFGLALEQQIDTAYRWLHEIEMEFHNEASVEKARKYKDVLVSNILTVMQQKSDAIASFPRSLSNQNDCKFATLTCPEDAADALQALMEALFEAYSNGKNFDFSENARASDIAASASEKAVNLTNERRNPLMNSECEYINVFLQGSDLVPASAQRKDLNISIAVAFLKFASLCYSVPMSSSCYYPSILTHIKLPKRVPLEVPFCVEVSGSHFLAIEETLTLLLQPQHQSAKNSHAIQSVLQILLSNISVLIDSHADPNEVLQIFQGHSGAEVIARIRQLLVNVAATRPDLGIIVADILDKGLNILYPSPLERVQLLIGLLKKEVGVGNGVMQKTGTTSKNEDHLNFSTKNCSRYLLDRILWQFCSSSTGVLSLFGASSDDSEHSKAVKVLVEVLLDVCTNITCEELRACIDTDSSPNKISREEDIFVQIDERKTSNDEHGSREFMNRRNNLGKFSHRSSKAYQFAPGIARNHRQSPAPLQWEFGDSENTQPSVVIEAKEDAIDSNENLEVCGEAKASTKMPLSFGLENSSDQTCAIKAAGRYPTSLRVAALRILALYQRHLLSASAPPQPRLDLNLEENVSHKNADDSISTRERLLPTLEQALIVHSEMNKSDGTQKFAVKIRNDIGLIGKDDVLERENVKIDLVKCQRCQYWQNAHFAGVPKAYIDEINTCQIVYECVFCETHRIESSQRELGVYTRSLGDKCVGILTEALSLVKDTFDKSESRIDQRAVTLVVERLEHSCLGVLFQPLCTALPLLAGSARNDSSPLLIPSALPTIIQIVSLIDRLSSLELRCNWFANNIGVRNEAARRTMLSINVEDKEAEAISKELVSNSNPSSNSPLMKWRCQVRVQRGSLGRTRRQSVPWGPWRDMPRGMASTIEKAVLDSPGERTLRCSFSWNNGLLSLTALFAPYSAATGSTTVDLHIQSRNTASFNFVLPDDGSDRHVASVKIKAPGDFDMLRGRRRERDSSITSLGSTGSRQRLDLLMAENGLPTSSSILRKLPERGGLVHVPWLLDAEMTLSITAGDLAACMVTGARITSTEIELLPWLKCPLFGNGMSETERKVVASTSKITTEVKKISKSKASHIDGASIFAWMRKIAPKRFILGYKLKSNKPVGYDDILFAYLECLLHHTGLRPLALQGISNEERGEGVMKSLPPSLITLFRETMALRDLLRNKKKEYEKLQKQKEAKTPYMSPEGSILETKQEASVLVLPGANLIRKSSEKARSLFNGHSEELKHESKTIESKENVNHISFREFLGGSIFHTIENLPETSDPQDELALGEEARGEGHGSQEAQSSPIHGINSVGTDDDSENESSEDDEIS